MAERDEGQARAAWCRDFRAGFERGRGGEDTRDQRAALVERIAALIHETFVPDPANRFAPRFTCYDESAEAVLSLLESGRAGVWLVPAVGVLDTVGVVITQLRDTKTELVEARAEIEQLRMACATQSHEVEQTLGKALRYPTYGPDMFPDFVPDGSVCVGDHVPESLAVEAADSLSALRAEIERLRGQRDAAREDARRACAEVERLRGAMFPDGWPCPNPANPEGCYCPGDGPCVADQH